MSRSTVLTGQTFVRWTVLGPIVTSKRTMWECLCSCGTRRTVAGYTLTSGSSRSCGCLNREETRKRLTTHGKTSHPLFAIWKGMLTRCTNPNTKSWKHYGERGILVCERWDSFEKFYEDMAPSWLAGLTIERIENDKGYEPSNCRWAPKSEQSRNRRYCIYIDTPAGRLTVAEAARTYGIEFGTLRGRIKRGWPSEELLRPAGPKGTNGSDRANWSIVCREEH